ncbi:transcriptional regulator PerR [Anaerotignum neopropionicum]|uniref:Transcriptional regulator PerR n=1 Tax=Anaerotignum neopropionicum TaxID=36847 RepID=A0A136WJ75_9FIRM|nr:Fur family transcriptional regulator [Anaerotignum neopropionicum]KXL54514.1 transcriptional regulator PerR [Anaerotignum neopropionicum]
MKATAQILKEKGLKVTPQRIAVYNMLLNTTEHPNAETIYKALEPTNPTMSLATVYKTLDYFKQLGLVQELNVGEGSSRYDAVVKCHPHTVCIQCGKVRDLYLEELTEIHKKIAEELDFEVRCEQLILYGICGKCRRENNENS